MALNGFQDAILRRSHEQPRTSAEMQQREVLKTSSILGFGIRVVFLPLIASTYCAGFVPWGSRGRFVEPKRRPTAAPKTARSFVFYLDGHAVGALRIFTPVAA